MAKSHSSAFFRVPKLPKEPPAVRETPRRDAKAIAAIQMEVQLTTPLRNGRAPKVVASAPQPTAPSKPVPRKRRTICPASLAMGNISNIRSPNTPGHNSDDDDEFLRVSRVNPHEEYSEKYYAYVKAGLIEDGMSEEKAQLMINVERRMHEKRPLQTANLKMIVLGGRFDINTTYEGFYPDDYKHCDKLFICDGCFRYFPNFYQMKRHVYVKKCTLFGAPPPGDEVYRDENSSAGFISVFRVSGEKQSEYCSRLCLLACLFLKDKVVHSIADLPIFDFYVVTEFTQKDGFRPCGYFSRYRYNLLDTNLNCICVFPCYQKHGFGRFLIDFSYQMSVISAIPGGPERPLSDAGLVTYTSYWKRTVAIKLAKVQETDLKKLETELGMREADIVEVIQNLFSTTTKNGELMLNRRLVNEIAKDEQMKDRAKLYPKWACIEPGFQKYLHELKDTIKKMYEDTENTVKTEE